MYEDLIIEAEEENIEVHEINFTGNIKGLYSDNIIAINSNLSSIEKRCILAEELGHYHTTYGNILDQSTTTNKKLEKRARNWGYEKLVSFEKLIEAFNNNIQGKHPLAEYLEITPEFLDAAIAYYYKKYGEYHKIGVYTLFFNPLGMFRSFE